MKLGIFITLILGTCLCSAFGQNRLDENASVGIERQIVNPGSAKTIESESLRNHRGDAPGETTSRIIIDPPYKKFPPVLNEQQDTNAGGGAMRQVNGAVPGNAQDRIIIDPPFRKFPHAITSTLVEKALGGRMREKKGDSNGSAFPRIFFDQPVIIDPPVTLQKASMGAGNRIAPFRGPASPGSLERKTNDSLRKENKGTGQKMTAGARPFGGNTAPPPPPPPINGNASNPPPPPPPNSGSSKAVPLPPSSDPGVRPHLDPSGDLFTKESKGSGIEASQGSAPGPGSFGRNPIGAELFSIDVHSATGDRNIIGVEFDGDQWWLTGSSNEFKTPFLYKLSRSGVLINQYPQPPANRGHLGWRDLAFDGEFLYASDAGAAPWSITQIQPITGMATGFYIPSPIKTACALAYDRSTDSFWMASDSDSRIYNVARDGSILAQYNNLLSGVSGMAMEVSAGRGRTLWIWWEPGPGLSQASRFDPLTGQFIGGVYDDSVVPFPGPAGGACAFNDPRGTGKWVLAVIQGGPPGLLKGYSSSDADPVARVDHYGAPGPGTAGSPEIEMLNPYIMAQHTLRLTSSSHQAEAGIVFVGSGAANLPIGSGGYSLLVDFQQSLPVILGPGVTKIISESPPDLWFVNTFWQLVQTDPGGQPGLGTRIAVSDGLRVFIGGPDY